jgi:hypothetical protein
MSEIRTEFLFEITLDVPRIADLGATPLGHRRIAQVAGGHFEGPRMRGTAHPGGGDWLLLRNDGVLQLDVRVTLETHDGHLVYMTYRGVRHGPAEIMQRLNAGEEVDPSSYYFRTTPSFETGSEKYAWLNAIVCISTGHRTASGPVYRVYEVL